MQSWHPSVLDGTSRSLGHGHASAVSLRQCEKTPTKVTVLTFYSLRNTLESQLTDSTKEYTVKTVGTQGSRVVYWHRELPPFDADPVAEYLIEASSSRVPGTLVHRDELWRECHENLMVNTANRLEQEVARLGGHYAHVLDESIESRHDAATGEAWLHGRFNYVLYRQPVNRTRIPRLLVQNRAG